MQHFPAHSLMAAVASSGLDFGFGSLFMVFLLVAVLWTLAWKGVALWHAARNRQMVWFIVMLVVNTLGILEIVYYIFFRKDQNITTTDEIIASGVIVEVVE